MQTNVRTWVKTETCKIIKIGPFYQCSITQSQSLVIYLFTSYYFKYPSVVKLMQVPHNAHSLDPYGQFNLFTNANPLALELVLL